MQLNRLTSKCQRRDEMNFNCFSIYHIDPKILLNASVEDFPKEGRRRKTATAGDTHSPLEWGMMGFCRRPIASCSDPLGPSTIDLNRIYGRRDCTSRWSPFVFVTVDWHQTLYGHFMVSLMDTDCKTTLKLTFVVMDIRLLEPIENASQLFCWVCYKNWN